MYFTDANVLVKNNPRKEAGKNIRVNIQVKRTLTLELSYWDSNSNFSVMRLRLIIIFWSPNSPSWKTMICMMLNDLYGYSSPKTQKHNSKYETTCGF